jgi:Xaa-Pro aminopeptidase
LRDPDQLRRIQNALAEEKLDAVVCALPMHVLMLSGYWPVVGTSLCVATRDGRRVLLVPADEEELARQGDAGEIETYQPATLERVQSVNEAAAPELRRIFQRFGLTCGRVGYEHGAAPEPASYSAMRLFNGGIVDLLHEATPANALAPADEMLARLAAVKTPYQVERIRTACAVAGAGFRAGATGLRPGLAEAAAAELFRGPMITAGLARPGVERADAFAWCMAGRNSAQASAAYARSRDTRLARHEFVLVHCNSTADGYWSDVTRTYVLGTPQERQMKIYEAIFAARAAALAAIHPGARAADVDRAAREVLRSRGFGDDQFRHPAGHGVGFSAIAPGAMPRIHPHSPDVLETGMVFNVEPAVYIEGYGGARHCDVVAVTASGAEVLTPFQAGTDDLVLRQLREAA